MMMAPPQVVGVLLKKPGQHEDPQNHNPRIPPLDPQEIKIRGELYVEVLGEQRMVTIRMGWLWVEGTPMRLPLRALNLRQAAPSLCQPHASALGFTLSNPQNGTLATFWADTEPIYWSWVRAIAAELVRQTPFRAQRSLNFLEILTICPRGPVPLPDSPTESRRRSRSELRSWFRNSSSERQNNSSLTFEESRRRARSELRGWSSNSSDEDVLGEFRTLPHCIIPKDKAARPWAFSESSEGSDDSLPWGGGQSSVDSVDSITGPTIVIAEPETREQRIQRYKEARRRENEARSRRVVEEDARRRKARAEENNNNVSLAKLTKACYGNVNLNKVEQHNNNNNNNNISSNNNNNNNNNKNKNHNVDLSTTKKVVGVETLSHNGASGDKSLRKDSTLFNICRISPITKTTSGSLTNYENGTVMDTGEKLSLLKKSSLVKVQGNFVRFEEQKNHANAFNHTVAHTIQQKNDSSSSSSASSSANERRSRARERRSVRESRQPISVMQTSSSIDIHQVETLRQRKERLASLSSRIPILQETSSSAGVELLSSTSFNSTLNTTAMVSAVGSNNTSFKTRDQKSPSYFSLAPEPCEESVARLLERCQRVDHYVPVRDKLTLFESLSRLGGRLARSTEDLGRIKSNPSPRGKQRARSLHDLNRASKSVPVREMCRFFEGEKSIDDDNISRVGIIQRGRISSDSITSSTTRSRTWSDGNVFSQLTLPPITLSAKTTPIKINSSSNSPTKSCGRRKQYAK